MPERHVLDVYNAGSTGKLKFCYFVKLDYFSTLLLLLESLIFLKFFTYGLVSCLILALTLLLSKGFDELCGSPIKLSKLLDSNDSIISLSPRFSLFHFNSSFVLSMVWRSELIGSPVGVSINGGRV